MMESDIVALWGKVVSCQRVVVHKPWKKKKKINKGGYISEAISNVVPF